MRNKDFILESENGKYNAREGNGSAVKNRILTSILIAKGSFISDSDYGSLIGEIKKAVPNRELLLKRHIENALKHTSSDGSFNVLDVHVSINTTAGFAKIKITAIHAGKTIITEEEIVI